MLNKDDIIQLRDAVNMMRRGEDISIKYPNIQQMIERSRKFTDDLMCGVDEDYHCKCLSCGAIVLAGKCCDNFVSQYMIDKNVDSKK